MHWHQDCSLHQQRSKHDKRKSFDSLSKSGFASDFILGGDKQLKILCQWIESKCGQGMKIKGTILNEKGERVHIETTDLRMGAFTFYNELLEAFP